MANKAQEPVYLKRRKVWRELLMDTRGHEGESVAQRRLEMLDLWSRDWWAYLSARDLPTEKNPEGRPIIWTVDERDETAPIKPFPVHKEYLKGVGEELWKHRICFLDKARQMYITTFCALLLDWFCSFKLEREVFVSRLQEKSAVKLINDKIRTVHQKKPKWLQDACPMTKAPAHLITYTHTGSTITGVGQTFAISDARGPTGSINMIDEAAYQEYFEQVYQAVVPATSRLWAITTANIGNAGAEFFRKCIKED